MFYTNRIIGLTKATNLVRRGFLPNQPKELTEQDVQAARQYIKGYWPHLTRFHENNDDTLLGLPKPYLVPSYDPKASFDFNEMFYWDSYFMVQGMYDEEHQELVSGILEDLTSLFDRFKVIPNASRTYFMGRSQPPFLTTFIFEVYETYHLKKAWLKKNITVAEAEYKTVWMGTKKPNYRQMYQGLSRYYDINALHDLAEADFEYLNWLLA